MVAMHQYRSVVVDYEEIQQNLPPKRIEKRSLRHTEKMRPASVPYRHRKNMILCGLKGLRDQMYCLSSTMVNIWSHNVQVSATTEAISVLSDKLHKMHGRTDQRGTSARQCHRSQRDSPRCSTLRPEGKPSPWERRRRLKVNMLRIAPCI